MRNPFSLENKTILVTGASSGIGRSTAILCSQMGASVVIGGRNETKLGETFALMEGGNHTLMVGDLSIGSLMSSLVCDLPSLDGVVHCVGIGQRVPCRQLTENDIDQVMDINFKIPVLLQAELLRSKKINKGASLVFIASIASSSGSLGHSVYSASKGALVSYSNCLALELAQRQIRVNCISPAMVWTDLIVREGVEINKIKEDEASYPLKRYGKPEDIASLAIYMLSDASSWMTGSNVVISGGAK